MHKAKIMSFFTHKFFCYFFSVSILYKKKWIYHFFFICKTCLIHGKEVLKWFEAISVSSTEETKYWNWRVLPQWLSFTKTQRISSISSIILRDLCIQSAECSHNARTQSKKQQLFLSYLEENGDKLIDFPLSFPVCLHLPIYSVCSVLRLSAIHQNYNRELFKIQCLSLL